MGTQVGMRLEVFQHELGLKHYRPLDVQEDLRSARGQRSRQARFPRLLRFVVNYLHYLFFFPATLLPISDWTQNH